MLLTLPLLASLPGDDYVLIGGYESGVDAAVNLAKASHSDSNSATTSSSSSIGGYESGFDVAVNLATAGE